MFAAAEEARQRFREAEDAKRDLEREVEKVETWLKNDYGPNGEFAKLEGECFSIKQRQYTYQMCPFGEAKQKEGYSETSIGHFSGWEADGDNKYAKMTFKRGAYCWQGPDRSLSVTFECHSSNEILAVDEPSKCVYTMRFGTPAACDQAQAESLRAELKAKFADDEEQQQQPQQHGSQKDEL